MASDEDLVEWLRNGNADKVCEALSLAPERVNYVDPRTLLPVSHSPLVCATPETALEMLHVLDRFSCDLTKKVTVRRGAIPYWARSGAYYGWPYIFGCGTLLHWMAQMSLPRWERYNVRPLLQWLLSLGLDINERNEDGWPPLMYAMKHNNPAHLRVMVSLGADVRMTARWKKNERTIVEHCGMTGMCNDAHGTLLLYSGWSPAAHRTFPAEMREFVNSIFAVYCVGDYGDSDEALRVTRLHDLPPELLFEIVATALLEVECRPYGTGVLKESTDAFDVFKLDESE